MKAVHVDLANLALHLISDGDRTADGDRAESTNDGALGDDAQGLLGYLSAGGGKGVEDRFSVRHPKAYHVSYVPAWKRVGVHCVEFSTMCRLISEKYFPW